MKKEVQKSPVRPDSLGAHRGSGKEATADRKTILIFSPDVNLCASLSMLFQDRYDVVTTSDLKCIERLASDNCANLAIVDEVPSERLISAIDSLHARCTDLPVLLLYVYNARDVAMDCAMRGHVDAVFYKPVEITAVSKRIDELLCN